MVSSDPLAWRHVTDHPERGPPSVGGFSDPVRVRVRRGSRGWRRAPCRRPPPRRRAAPRRSRLVEVAPRRAATSSASSAYPERGQPLPVVARLAVAEGQLALDHREHVGRDPGVEGHPTLGAGHDVAFEELAHRLDQLDGGRAVVGAVGDRARSPAAGTSTSGPAPSSRSRSCSASQVRRPMAASSTDREAPERWALAWSMQMAPQRRQPQRLPPAHGLRIDRRARWPLRRRRTARRSRRARPRARRRRSARPGRRASPGPPSGRRRAPAPSRARPAARRARRRGCPRRKSPCTTHRSTVPGRSRSSHRIPSSRAGWGSSSRSRSWRI